MKKNKNHNKKIKRTYYLLGFIAIFILLVVLINQLNINNKFVVKSRVENIKQEKEKDEDFYKTIAWLRVQGTNIDYPIIAYENEDSDEDANKKSYGWSYWKKEKFSNNMIVTGHNILNLSSKPIIKDKDFTRFESMMSFIYYDFAKENQFMQYTIDGKDYKYQIFGVTIIGDLDFYINYNYKNANKKELKRLIEFVNENSIYDYDIKVDTKDDILNVMTCSRLYGSEEKVYLMVSTKRIENNNNKYINVEKNKNYNNLEKKLKGAI